MAPTGLHAVCSRSGNTLLCYWTGPPPPPLQRLLVDDKLVVVHAAAPGSGHALADAATSPPPLCARALRPGAEDGVTTHVCLIADRWARAHCAGGPSDCLTLYDWVICSATRRPPERGVGVPQLGDLSSRRRKRAPSALLRSLHGPRPAPRPAPPVQRASSLGISAEAPLTRLREPLTRSLTPFSACAGSAFRSPAELRAQVCWDLTVRPACFAEQKLRRADRRQQISEETERRESLRESESQSAGRSTAARASRARRAFPLLPALGVGVRLGGHLAAKERSEAKESGKQRSRRLPIRRLSGLSPSAVVK